MSLPAFSGYTEGTVLVVTMTRMQCQKAQGRMGFEEETHSAEGDED